MSTLVPPGGFAGYAQMTNASKMQLAKGARRIGGKRRKSTKASRGTGKRRAKRRSASKGLKRLVKGSAAAKAYMKKIRRKRRK